MHGEGRARCWWRRMEEVAAIVMYRGFVGGEDGVCVVGV